MSHDITKAVLAATVASNVLWIVVQHFWLKSAFKRGFEMGCTVSYIHIGNRLGSEAVKNLADDVDDFVKRVNVERELRAKRAKAT